MQQDQIKAFLEKFSAGVHTEEEHQQFIEWVKTAPVGEVEAIVEEYKSIFESTELSSANPELISEIETALNQYELGKESYGVRGRIIPLKTMRKVAVAASIILAVGVGSYFLFFNHTKQNDIAKTNQPSPYDVKAPETNYATITLADGRKVPLGMVSNGTLATQGNVKVVKLADGKIAYTALRQAQGDKEMEYNTLNNPRGSKVIDMTLADGSRVWLNAGSSITYPVAFVGHERKISIIGEAYFEIAHDATKPFYVTKGDMNVQVLGTHFNVNAYDDEPDIKVTLLEGSVKVKNANGSELLKPGEQAQVSDKITIAGKVNVEEIMAWKNGLFNFNSTDIKTMMRQIEKWYDVKVVYQDNISELFVAKISRDVPLSEFLKLIELTNLVHFRIEGLPDDKAGKTIVVTK